SCAAGRASPRRRGTTPPPSACSGCARRTTPTPCRAPPGSSAWWAIAWPTGAAGPRGGGGWCAVGRDGTGPPGEAGGPTRAPRDPSAWWAVAWRTGAAGPRGGVGWCADGRDRTAPHGEPRRPTDAPRDDRAAATAAPSEDGVTLVVAVQHLVERGAEVDAARHRDGEGAARDREADLHRERGPFVRVLPLERLGQGLDHLGLDRQQIARGEGVQLRLRRHHLLLQLPQLEIHRRGGERLAHHGAEPRAGPRLLDPFPQLLGDPLPALHQHADDRGLLG